MVLRTLRWVSAGILAAAALLAAPARSEAGTQILIEETDAAGSTVSGTTKIFLGTSATYATPNFLNIQVGTTPNTGAISSLNTSVTSALASSFASGHQLRVVVTSDGYTNQNPGQSAPVENNAGVSNGAVGGLTTVTSQTQLFTVPLSPGAGTNQTAVEAGGTPLGAATDVAKDTLPTSGTTRITTANISNMPNAFAIQQTIYVRVDGSILSGSTVGATAGSTVFTTAAPPDNNMVPAPPAIVLALAAVPVLGLRRFLRRKSSEATKV